MSSKLREGLGKLGLDASFIQGVEDKAAKERAKRARRLTDAEFAEWYEQEHRPKEAELQRRHEVHKRQVKETPEDDPLP